MDHFKHNTPGHKSKTKLYADNVLLYSTITSLDDCQQLKADINALEQWAKSGS